VVPTQALVEDGPTRTGNDLKIAGTIPTSTLARQTVETTTTKVKAANTSRHRKEIKRPPPNKTVASLHPSPSAKATFRLYRP